MAGATAGEIFIVARVKDFSTPIIGLAQFGTGYATVYADGGVWNDFGTTDQGSYSGPPGSLLTNPHVLDASVNADGDSLLRFNGIEYVHLTGQTVSFRPDPLIGGDWFGEHFNGDIAEVILYDHVLSDAERATVNSYLGSKYSVAISGGMPPPTPTLTAAAVSPTRVALSWTAADGATAALERKTGDGGRPQTRAPRQSRLPPAARPSTLSSISVRTRSCSFAR